MTYVKICGITSVDDARAAVDAGADAIGINFVPGSPRCVDVETAVAISRAVAGQVVRVGVFLDPAPDGVRERVDRVGLDVVELHGAAPPARRCSRCRYGP